MRLRTQVTLGIVAVAGVVVAILFGVVLPQLDRTFLDIERSGVETHVDRARNALQSELDALEATAHDWGAWDETLTFVGGENDGFAGANLLAETFTNLRLNAMVFLDPAGRVVAAPGFDLEVDAPMALPEAQLAWIREIVASRRRDTETASYADVASVGDGLALVGVHPILNSLHEAPARGTIVLVRCLTPAEVKRLSDQIQLPLELRKVDDPQNDVGLLPFLTGTHYDSPPTAVVPLGADVVAGYTLWRDLRGESVAVLGVETPRDAYQEGVSSLRNLMLGLLSALVVFGGGFLVFLNVRVLSPTARLTQTVARIARLQDTSQRVCVRGRDELAHLGTSINGMLDSIDESRTALAQSEKRYHNLFESSRDPIYITAEDGRFIDVNQALVDLFGFTKEEITRVSASELYVHPGDREAFRSVIREKGFVASYPVMLRKKDGTHLRCLLTSIAESPAEGAPPIYQGIIRDVTELLRQQEELTFLATHDTLTGLLTRGALDDVMKLEISRAMRNLERLAVFYLDLDRFKEVNDTHGHAAGDLILKEVGTRLREALRASDTIARLGGDEFVALLPGIDSPRDAEIAADKVLQAMRDAFPLADNGSFGLSASIGIALYPDDGESGTHLLQRADAAMYAAKTEGRDSWRRFGRGVRQTSAS